MSRPAEPPRPAEISRFADYSRSAEDPRNSRDRAESSRGGIIISIGGRRKRGSRGKLRIKKRVKPLRERRAPWRAFADWADRVALWCTCVRKERAYRKVFLGALWGEMGEYGYRAPTFWAIMAIIGAFVGLKYLPDAIFLIKLKAATFVALIVIAVWLLSGISAPIWWADRYAVAQTMKYYEGEEIVLYERSGEAMRRLREQYKVKLPLKASEIPFLAELYRQFLLGVMSEYSWEALGEYTKEEIEFFYKIVGIEESDKRFPEHVLKQPAAT